MISKSGIYFQPKQGTVGLFRGLSRGRSLSDNPRKSPTVPSLGWKYNILFHRQFRWEGRFLYTFPRCRWKSIKTFTRSGGKYIKTFPLSEVRSEIKFHWKIRLRLEILGNASETTTTETLYFSTDWAEILHDYSLGGNVQIYSTEIRTGALQYCSIPCSVAE